MSDTTTEKTQAPIIAIANQKGGSGKTITAMNVAYVLAAKRNLKVLLVDADMQQQGSMRMVQRRMQAIEKAKQVCKEEGKTYKGYERLPFTVISMTQPILHEQLPPMKYDYDVILIDGSPRADDISRSIIRASDAVIIPLQPNGSDLDGTIDFVELILNKQEVNDQFRSAMFFTRFKPDTRLGRSSNQLAMIFPDIPLLPATFQERIAYQVAHTEGLTTCELRGRSRDSYAAAEVDHFVTTLMDFCKGTLDKSYEDAASNVLGGNSEEMPSLIMEAR